jgi:hypothetical protein
MVGAAQICQEGIASDDAPALKIDRARGVCVFVICLLGINAASWGPPAAAG